MRLLFSLLSGCLPIASATFTESYGDVFLDGNRSYGDDVSVSGDLYVNVTGAISCVSRVLHKDTQIPTITSSVSVTTVGDYVPGIVNTIYVFLQGSTVRCIII